MWAFWASDTAAGRRAGWAGIGALALCAALTMVGALPRPAGAQVREEAADSGRAVRNIRVGPAGIEIEGEEAAPGRERRGGRVRIGPGGIHIQAPGTSDSGGDRVEVDVPGVRIRGPHVRISEGSAAEVRAFSDIHVGPNEQIDGDVVAVCGSVTVEGRVSGDVVAVCGSVELGPHAVVEGSAVAIGGVLKEAEGSTVGDETVSLGFLPVSFGLPTLPMLLLTILVCWLLTVFMAWLLSLLFPDRLQRVATTVSRSAAGSFFLGLVSLPLLVILGLLLFVTVIGIPIALLLPLLYAIAVWTGQIAATSLLGCRLMGRRPGETAPFGPAVLGSLFVAMFFVAGAVLGAPQGMMMRSLALFFSLLGMLLIMGLSIIGTGAFLISRAGSRPREARPETPAGALAPTAMHTPPPATR